MCLFQIVFMIPLIKSNKVLSLEAKFEDQDVDVEAMLLLMRNGEKWDII